MSDEISDIIPVSVEQLVNEENSCVKSITCRRHLALSPKYLGQISCGLTEILNEEVNLYSTLLGGVPMSYKKITVQKPYGRLINDSPYVHFNAEINYFVFGPEKNSVIKGVVNKVGQDYVGCLIHQRFNASISRPRCESIQTDWIGSKLQVGDEFLLVVEKVLTQNGIVSLKGKFHDSVFKKETSKKRKASDVIDGLEIEDLPHLPERKRRHTNKSLSTGDNDDIDTTLDDTMDISLLSQERLNSDVDTSRRKKKKKNKKKLENENSSLQLTLSRDSSLPDNIGECNTENYGLVDKCDETTNSIENVVSDGYSVSQSSSSQKKKKKKRRDNEMGGDSSLFVCTSVKPNTSGGGVIYGTNEGDQSAMSDGDTESLHPKKKKKHKYSMDNSTCDIEKPSEVLSSINSLESSSLLNDTPDYGTQDDFNVSTGHKKKKSRKQKRHTNNDDADCSTYTVNSPKSSDIDSGILCADDNDSEKKRRKKAKKEKRLKM